MPPHTLSEMVKLTARVPRGHDGFWSIILGLDAKGPWTLRQLDDETNVNRASSKDYVHRLERGGFVARVGTAPGKRGISTATLWKLIKAPVDAPRLDRHGKELKESAEQLLWRSMRILKSFTARELREAAELDDRPIALNTARHYAAALTAAGVLVGTPAKPPQGWTYRLVRDLGPKAPSVSNTEVVFDRNSRQVIGEPEIRVAP